MGQLILPPSGTIYIDTPIAIYTADVHPKYASVVQPLWEAVANGALRVISGELTLVETLVLSLRLNDALMLQQREAIWQQKNTSLLPIIREAARLRALIVGLKTPDALHAATALLHGCALFVTNDEGFKRVAGLPLVLLDDALAAP